MNRRTGLIPKFTQIIIVLDKDGIYKQETNENDKK